ncbi:EXD2 [Symbiodinium sp. CCMP2592]|nr:EXD2 [Symbiodinium sp. CCMP2592]
MSEVDKSQGRPRDQALQTCAAPARSLGASSELGLGRLGLGSRRGVSAARPDVRSRRVAELAETAERAEPREGWWQGRRSQKGSGWAATQTEKEGNTPQHVAWRRPRPAEAREDARLGGRGGDRRSGGYAGSRCGGAGRSGHGWKEAPSKEPMMIVAAYRGYTRDFEL